MQLNKHVECYCMSFLSSHEYQKYEFDENELNALLQNCLPDSVTSNIKQCDLHDTI